MEFMKKFITLLVIFVISIGAYLLLNTSEPIRSSSNESPITTVEAVKQVIEPVRTTSKVSEQEVITPVEEVDQAVETDDKKKSYKLNRIENVSSIMQFVKNNGGIDNLTIGQRLRVAKSLQYCGILPKHDPEAMESLNDDLYIAGFQSSTEFTNKMCKEVPDSLIFESYSILEIAANEGDMRAIIQFYDALTPEMLEASMANKNKELNIEKLKLAHLKKSEYLLIDSIYNGNVSAARRYSFAKWRVKAGVYKNHKESLGYYLATSSIRNRPPIAVIIESMHSELTLQEIEEAEEFAANLVTHWKSLPEGIWER
jgi:hypothetical protein